MGLPARVLETGREGGLRTLPGGRAPRELALRPGRSQRQKAGAGLAFPLLLVAAGFLLSQALGAAAAGVSRETGQLRERLALAEVANHTLVEDVARRSAPEPLMARAEALGMVVAGSRVLLPAPPSPRSSDLPAATAGKGTLAEARRGTQTGTGGEEGDGRPPRLMPVIWGAFAESW
jgi:hypothetical protein